LLRKKAVEAHEMLLQTMPMEEEAAWREGSSRMGRRMKGMRGASGVSTCGGGSACRSRESPAWL
jgi:hypothetical protein